MIQYSFIHRKINHFDSVSKLSNLLDTLREWLLPIAMLQFVMLMIVNHSVQDVALQKRFEVKGVESSIQVNYDGITKSHN